MARRFRRRMRKRRGRRRYPMARTGKYLSLYPSRGRYRGRSLGFGFPQSLIMRHRYTDTHTMTPGAVGVVDSEIYNLNSMYDPYQTGAGHQPGFRDTMATLYFSYIVLGAKITVRFISQDSTYINRVGLTITEGTTAQTNGQYYIETGGTNYCLLHPAGGGTASECTLKKFFSAKKYFKTGKKGVKNLAIGVGSDPEQIVRAHIWCDSPEGTDTGNVLAEVTLDQTVMWLRPQVIAAS